MKILQKPKSTHLVASAQLCLDNGDRLLEQRYDLEFREPSATRFYMAMIAQEEFAKAFMLLLVRDDVIPFSSPILRAMNDHTCKQLVGMIMDYVIMHWDETDEFMAMIAADSAFGEDRFPDDIGSALELLRYEKIGRWESRAWVWGEDPDYDKSAIAIAEGKKDRLKQDALYVRIGKDGRVVSTPDSCSLEDTKKEEDRAGRYYALVRGALEGGGQNYRYDRIVKALKFLFEHRL